MSVRQFVIVLALSTAIACAEDSELSDEYARGTARPSPTESPATGSHTNAPIFDPTIPVELAALFEAERRLYTLLPTQEDMPAGWLSARGGPYSEGPGDCIAPCPDIRPVPNASVEFELTEPPQDAGTISCVDFFIAKYESVSLASEAFGARVEIQSYPRNTPGVSQREVEVPTDIGHERWGEIFRSDWEVGACGTRAVHVFHGLYLRYDNYLINIHGYTEASDPEHQLVEELARMQVARIESALRK